MSRAAAIAGVCAMTLLAGGAHAAAIAIVTDLQGEATVASASRPRKLTILSEIAAGDRVQLPANATLVTLYLDGGAEYVVKGAATVEFNVMQPEVLSGPALERRGPPLGNGSAKVYLRPGSIAQGAMVMRGIGGAARLRAANLNRTLTLDTQPEFRWSDIAPGQVYSFGLADETGRTILETSVEDSSFKLPADVKLRESVPYTWVVSAVLPDGQRYSTSAVFAVAPRAVRAEADAMRPPASASVSTTVAYAAWLQQEELRDEARKYWQSASARRPDDPRLRAFAAR